MPEVEPEQRDPLRYAAPVLFALLGALSKRDDFLQTARWLLYLGTLGAIVATASGVLAANQLGHDGAGHDLVHVHRNMMYGATLLAVAVSGIVFFLRSRNDMAMRWALVGLLLLSTAAMTLGADRGALLVFRYGIGTAGQEPPHSEHGHEHGGQGSHGH